MPGHTPRGAYGIDAPPVLFGLGAGGVILLGIAVANAVVGAGPVAVVAPLISSLYFLASAGLFLYATRRGKFVLIDTLLDDVALTGDERILDLGCGRGAMLLAAARRIPDGRAVGIDIWHSRDQSGNRQDATRRNAEAQGVADRVDLHTGDITELPFADGEFDVVLSSLVVHNIHDRDKRDRAIREAFRVLRPGGRLLILDLQARNLNAYARQLEDAGALDVSVRPLGWRGWFGGPWVAMSAVTAARATT